MTVETYFIMAEGNSVALRGCPTSITKAGPPSGYLFIYLFIYSFFDEQSQLDQPANTKISTAFCHFGYFTCSIIHLVSFFFFFFFKRAFDSFIGASIYQLYQLFIDKKRTGCRC